jgi:Protein of unknown function (DUF3305)
LNSIAQVRMPVGVVVERHTATSPWLDFTWRPASVFTGVPVAEPWTPLGPVGDATAFYAGTATIDLYRTETANYLSNLGSQPPLLWVVLRPTGTQPPYEVFTVTADPAEGEAFAEAGNDLVDTVPMPIEIAHIVKAFVAEHHIEQPFFKRQRDIVDPHAADRPGLPPEKGS